MKRFLSIAIPLVVTLVLLEIGVRIVDSRIHYLIPPELDFRGLSEYKTQKGYELYRPTQSASYNGYPIRINSLGFRGPEFNLDESRDATRIMVLGDSLAFGQGVAEGDAFPAVLESLLSEKYPGRKFVVMNASNPGANVVDEVNMLIDLYDATKPDVVIFGFCDNDIKRGPVFNTSIKARKWRSLWAFSQLVNGALINADILDDYFEDIMPSYDVNGDGWKTFEGALAELKSFKMSHGDFQTIAVYLAQVSPLRAKYSDFVDASKVELKSAFEENGVVFLDTEDTFARDGGNPEPDGSGRRDYSVSRWDRHPSAKAHAMYAKAIFDYLVKSPSLQRRGIYEMSSSINLETLSVPRSVP